MNPLLSGAIALLAGRLFGGGGGGGSSTSAMPTLFPEQRELIGIQKGQLRQADPLRQAILRLAMGLLPRYARRNLQPPAF